MQILEQELEQYLFENYKEIFKISLGKDADDGEIFNKPVEIQRQVELGNYGRIDLLVIYDDHLLIVELKQNNIDYGALGQICRYITAIEKISNYTIVNGLLIGRDLSEGDVCFALNSISEIDFWQYNLDLKTGISFKKNKRARWHLAEENLNSKSCQELVKLIKKHVQLIPF